MVFTCTAWKVIGFDLFRVEGKSFDLYRMEGKGY